MTKPISKSKRQLAQLLIEAGVTQFPEGANWAAQDSDRDYYSRRICFYSVKPTIKKGCSRWLTAVHNVSACVTPATLIPNWHQTVLSRDEFDQIVAETAVHGEPDSDGWIKWEGGDSPVGDDVTVDVKTRDGEIESDKACYWNWSHEKVSCISERQIIAYRLHNAEQSEAPTDGELPKQRAKLTGVVKVDVTIAPEPTPDWTTTAAPTLDQLLRDWRNVDDYAQRKQTEADEAAAMRDERWQAVQARAGEMGVTVERCEPAVGEPVPVIPVITGKFRNTNLGRPERYIPGND